MYKFVCALFIAAFILSSGGTCLYADPPPWSNLTYTDWNPGVDPAIVGSSSDRHYECRIVWDGSRFVNIHEQNRGPADYSLWIAYSADGRDWTTPTAIDVPRTWDIGHHAVACNPDNFPPSDTMNGDTDVKFKMWYAAYGDNYHYRYAESSDVSIGQGLANMTIARLNTRSPTLIQANAAPPR